MASRATIVQQWPQWLHSPCRVQSLMFYQPNSSLRMIGATKATMSAPHQ
jgi:hypothetical protein